MSWKPSAFWLVTAALWLAAAPLAFAAESILEGRVVDDSGNALPGATVVLQNEGAAFHERMTLTDPSGRFWFGALPPGPGYRLTVSLSGHATVIFSELQLSSGSTLTQDVTLRLGSELSETVRVQGKSDILDTEKVTASTTFSSTFMAELPILGRDYQDVLTLAPGVTDVNHTGNPNIHGARDTNVGTLVDGVATTDPFTGHFGQNLNIESILELEVITSAASAQYGRAQGGFANIITKSGGNEFQGTFKMFVRSNRLDGDGAGQEDPELQGGLNGGQLMSNLSFTDLKPFLSISGAFVRDKLWYYLSSEFILEETPVNALTEAYVFRTRGYREFLKTTWQINPTHTLAFSVIWDRENVENQGITSLRDVLSGYSTHRGGPTLTLKENSIFNPSVLLESSLSWFDNRFSQLPTMDPDTNGNGVLFVDDRPDLGGNEDGILDASERDPGEDWDLDGFYDINELTLGDLDRDGYVNGVRGCEGSQHEDLNCNYRLDAEVDFNLNGRLDPEEDTGIPCFTVPNCVPVDARGTHTAIKGTAGNSRWDTEDRNANGVLDTLRDSGYTVAPFWVDDNGNGNPEPGEYHAPLPPDQDLLTDSQGRTYGPYAYQFEDHRKRATWKEDLSLFVPDLGGTHEIKLGGVYEHEGYDSDTTQRPQVTFPLTSVQPVASPKEPTTSSSFVDTLSAQLGIPGNVNNTAVGDNLGLYLEDTYKPRPNLTLNLGVRFDRETLQSFGYTPVDPVAERSDYDALMNISGFDTRLFDGLTPVGLCRDPIHSCPETSDPLLAAMTSQLRGLAFQRLTRHNEDIDVLSGLLKNVTGARRFSGVSWGVGSGAPRSSRLPIPICRLA
ncbi:MAG: carboxypeptidase regulatory-like domain-containing protein [Acidobacteria bacterium]|nr:carboxypeptidase regulatory-like domain-containing protein [Acidobacteriota bacterium]